MNESENQVYNPTNDPIQPHTQLSSCIEILGFDEMVARGELNKIQVLYERIGQEIYNTRKKNYSWGFRVIEPQFLNFSERIILTSRLYKEETLADLNSVVFKLFIEFNNIILSTALHMQIPLRGMIRIGETYRGAVRSRKPAIMSGNDPLILSDLLKVFSIGEIFPNGFSEGLIPAVDVPFHFGSGLCKSFSSITNLDSIGIFMPEEYNKKNTADVTILSNMMADTDINGEKYLACNWKEWMSEHFNCSADTILAFAETEAKGSTGSHCKKWQSLIDYSASL
ncbi:MAG: hypothetical protein GY790_24215 [Bacteroidetes bacterium]|nr:hypothetical protein [Bacteroidota bacterium]